MIDDYFMENWPDKKELGAFSSRIPSTKFGSMEVDGLLLVNEEPGKTNFELSCIDSPVKYIITPPCVIVAECTIQPSKYFL